MSNQGTIRLKVINGAPSVDKLWNNRYRLEFLCDNNSPKEDWYYDNIASILPDYGVLQDADFGSGVSEGWEAIPGSVYPDMRLTETQYTYISSIGDKRVTLTYETLTSSWVEEKAEDTDYEINGLKRVSRTFVALPATVYDKVVGTSTIDSGGTTLYLGSFKIEKTEAKWKLTEVWLEAGILSLQQDFNNGLKKVSVQAFGMTSAAVSSALSEVTANHKLISQLESDYEGIKTSTFRYQINESITEDYKLNGLKSLSITELSSTNFTARDIGVVGVAATPQAGLYLGTQDIDNGGAIKVRESVWLEAGIINRGTVELDDGSLQQRVTSYLAVEPTAIGIVTSRQVGSFEGLSTFTITEILSSVGSIVSPTEPTLVRTTTRLEKFPLPGLITLKENSNVTYLSAPGVPGGLLNVNYVNYSFDLRGPVEVSCPSKKLEYIQTESEIQADDYRLGGATGLWSPGSWASTRVSGIDSTNKPFSVSKAYRGYRIPENLATFIEDPFTGRKYSSANNRYISSPRTTDSSVHVQIAYVDGYRMSAKVQPILEIGGGPENPVGKKYVTQVEIKPDFSDSDGKVYYRKTVLVKDVIGDAVDDAINGDSTNNILASYYTDSVIGFSPLPPTYPVTAYTLELDQSLFSSEDDYYVGGIITIFGREKNSVNKFEVIQRFIINSYDSVSNKILLANDIINSETLGLYTGGIETDINNYEFARISIQMYDTEGTIERARRVSSGIFVQASGSFIPYKQRSKNFDYTGWRLELTSGVNIGNSFDINVRPTQITNTNIFRVSSSEDAIAMLVSGIKFKLIPPAGYNWPPAPVVPPTP